LRTTIKPYKLKASGESLSRDDVNTWQQVLLGFLRQDKNNTEFLSGGGFAEWKTTDEDATNGLVAAPANVADEPAETATLRANFKNFLTTVATYSPQGFAETIEREATSFQWVIDLILKTFGLETKGEHFLALDDLKLEYGPDFTYHQGFMAVKDVICAGLLREGVMYEGRKLTKKEVLTPTVKNFITKEWLVKTHPSLPKHVRDTRGHLFTDERPTLHCNQQILAAQMPTMLAEINGKSDPSQGNISMGDTGGRGGYNNVNMGNVGSSQPRMMRPIRPNMRPVRPMSGRGLMRGAGAFRNIPSPPVRFTANGCYRCLEATPKRYDAAKTHQLRDCPWPPNQSSARQPQYRPQPGYGQPNFRVVVFPDPQTGQQQVATVSMGNTSAYDQGNQFYDGAQFYQPQHYEEASIQELSQDYYENVGSVENKDILY